MKRFKYCSHACYAKHRKITHSGICTFKNCKESIKAKKLCKYHYGRMNTFGKNAMNHPEAAHGKARSKRGSGWIYKGYKMVQINYETYPEHRLIMEKHIGRKLLPFPQEVVHHINGNKLDNRIENLEIIGSQSDHMKHHHELNPEFRKYITKDLKRRKDGTYKKKVS
jgi:hypothetical protein